MRPPFPFRLRRKGNGPCTVQRKRRFGAKRHVVPYLLMRGGPSKRPWEVESASALGAGPRPRNLHIPRFRLTPKARSFRRSSSPHENRFAGFSRGPGFAEIFGLSAHDGLLSCVGGCKTDLTCVFPPLPLCRPRTGLPAANPVARSDCARRRVPEPTAAKRRHLGVGSGERGKRSRGHTTTTPESRTHASNCGEAPHSSACAGRTRYKLASLERTVSHGPFLFLARPGGPHENPAKRFSWGEEKETERCETCPSGRGEYSEVSFDDNGGIPVTGLPVQIFTACPAPAAPARYRAGPTG